MDELRPERGPDQELQKFLDRAIAAQTSLETERTQAQEALAKLVAEKAKSKTADRPHWITIALAFVGPLTTVVAVVIAAFSFGVSRQSLDTAQANAKVAAQALKISEQNMKVAQRAYLAIANGRVEYEIAFNRKNPRATNATATVTFQVQNLGNTPAEIDSIRINVSAGDPFIMSEPRNDHGLFLTSPETTIGPKSSRVERYSLRFLTDKGTLDYIEAEEKKPIIPSLFKNPLNVTVDITYKNVFGEFLSTSACMEASSRSKTTVDCTPDRFK